MNVNNLIRQLTKTRKLLAISAFHETAEPAIQLSSSDYQQSIPFLKKLFKAFDRQGFEIVISLWGKTTAYSPAKQLAIDIRLRDRNLKEILGKNTDFSNNFSYQKFHARHDASVFILEYHYSETRSIWRSYQVDVTGKNIDIQVMDIVAGIVNRGTQFEGRVIDPPKHQTTNLSKQDIHAFALFASENVCNVRAWRGIREIFSNAYVESFQLTSEGLNITTRYPDAHHSLCWHKNDMKFIGKYFTEGPLLKREEFS